MVEQAPYSLMSELAKVKDKAKPPIHLWNPDNVKDIDMVIAADGTWFHEGTPITRQRLTHLFASVMRKEQQDYYLVTPVEKCRIRVVDAPFIVVLLENAGEGNAQTLTLTTNVADTFDVDADHPLQVETAGSETLIYVEVRDGLRARLNRNVYYQLIDLMVEQDDGAGSLGVWSHGEFFALLTAVDHP